MMLLMAAQAMLCVLEIVLERPIAVTIRCSWLAISTLWLVFSFWRQRVRQRRSEPDENVRLRHGQDKLELGSFCVVFMLGKKNRTAQSKSIAPRLLSLSLSLSLVFAVQCFFFDISIFCVFFSLWAFFLSTIFIADRGGRRKWTNGCMAWVEKTKFITKTRELRRIWGGFGGWVWGGLRKSSSLLKGPRPWALQVIYFWKEKAGSAKLFISLFPFPYEPVLEIWASFVFFFWFKWSKKKPSWSRRFRASTRCIWATITRLCCRWFWWSVKVCLLCYTTC